ncbi:hypothetical protein MXAN_6171 [Myxococcus xanthus DK 1622]|uniref:Uncharacterized protein n=1 Tax=Myxococcus xanthus (strain DK1622) TaxID=246197 RepID=Q1CZ71_MYXXD|nr:hypothetical protein MXAN_6171 [Myxococcus xanthus DK 1622]
MPEARDVLAQKHLSEVSKDEFATYLQVQLLTLQLNEAFS